MPFRRVDCLIPSSESNLFNLLLMILSDRSILEAIANHDIVIEPYSRDCLGTNSYDVHLSKYLACYLDEVIDAKKHNQVEHFEIQESYEVGDDVQVWSIWEWLGKLWQQQQNQQQQQQAN